MWLGERQGLGQPQQLKLVRTTNMVKTQTHWLSSLGTEVTDWQAHQANRHNAPHIPG